MKIIGVKVGDRYFITQDKEANWNRYSNLNGYIINGGIPDKSFKEEWNVIPSEVEKVQRWKSQPDINHRYELIDASLESDKFPKSMLRDDVAYYDGEEYEWKFKDEYTMYSSLYKLTSDKQPKILEDIEFEYTTIMETNEFNLDFDFSYKVFKTQYQNDGTKNITTKDITHQLLDELVFPEILLPMRPCSFSKKQTFDIIRMYIKDNINPKVAHITSDYDFCFTVKKRIPLAEVEKFTVDVNMFKKTKKKKYETIYSKDREVEIFNMAPKPYQDYSVVEGFVGNTYEDLKESIDSYCKSLIDFINEPVADCPHCKGRGVIIKESMDE